MVYKKGRESGRGDTERGESGELPKNGPSGGRGLPKSEQSAVESRAMNSEPSTSSEDQDEYKRISALSQVELTLMGDLEDVDVPPDLFENAKNACIERIGAILEFSKGGPLGGDEHCGIHVLNEEQLRKMNEWRSENFPAEAPKDPNESDPAEKALPSIIVEPSEAPGPSEASEDNIRNLDSAEEAVPETSEGRSEPQTEPQVVPGSQGSEDLEHKNQSSALPLPAKRRPGRPRKKKNQNLEDKESEARDPDFIEPLDLEIPDTRNANSIDNSKQAPALARGYDKVPVQEKRVEDKIEDQAGTSGPSDKLVEQGNSQKGEKVDRKDGMKMDQGSSQRKKKQKTEAEKLMAMDFGPKAGGSLRDIQARSSKQKLWTNQVQLEQRKMLEESVDHPKLSISNRVARKSKELEPVVLSEASDFPVMDIPEGSELSDQLVNLDEPESMDLDQYAPVSTSEASIASDSPVEDPLVNLGPNTTSIASNFSVKNLLEGSEGLDPLEDLDTPAKKSEPIPDVPNATIRRSTVQKVLEPPAEPKEDPFKCSNRLAILKTKRNALPDFSSASKRAKLLVPSIVKPSDPNLDSAASAEEAPGPSKLSEGKSERQTGQEAVPENQEASTVPVDREISGPGDQGSEEQESEGQGPKDQEQVIPIPAKRRSGRPRKEQNQNLEDKEPEARDADFIEPLDLEIPATRNANSINNSKQALAKQAEASEAPAESAPAPKPAYGPHAVIKEIPEWIRKYEVFEEDLPKHGRPWLFPLDHYRPGGPKAPDPRFKLMDQYIEEMRVARGYDKDPVQEKRVEDEIEDQAGTSGPSDKLVEQGNSQKGEKVDRKDGMKMDQGSSQRKKKQKTEAEKLMAMDFGPKAGGSLRDIQARSSKQKLWTNQVQLEQRKMLEESVDHPKLSISNRVARKSKELEPVVLSEASDFPVGNILEDSDRLVNQGRPESMDLDQCAHNATPIASSSPVKDLRERSESSDLLVDLNGSQVVPNVPNSTNRRSFVQEEPEPSVKPATPKEDPADSPIQVAIIKSKGNALPDTSSSSERAKILVPSIVKPSKAPSPSDGLVGNIRNLDSGEEAFLESSEGKEERQTEPEVVPRSQGSKTVPVGGLVILQEPGNQGPVIPIPAKRRPGRPRKKKNLNLKDKKPEAREPDFIEPLDLETLPTWNGMDNSFPDVDEPGPVPSIVKPSVVKNRHAAGTAKVAAASSELSDRNTGPKPVHGSKTVLVDQRSVIPSIAKRRPGKPRKEKESETREPDFRVPVDMPATRITKLLSPEPREVPKTRVTRLLSRPPIETPDLDDTRRLVPSTSQQGPSRDFAEKSEPKRRRNARSRHMDAIRMVQMGRPRGTLQTDRHQKKASEVVEDSGDDDDDVEEEKPVCNWNSCGTVFSKNKKFYKHVKNHVLDDTITRRNLDSDPTEFYKCRWAGCTRTEPFDAYQKMAKHMRGHTNEKPFNCVVREAQF
ncbi:Protein CBG15828 [Caenorhabditis briggsae]|uniref:Protein CBG15828 n=1 Tax=Caenorhabditis briggsae TaxID=6238 RepID=A8XMX9_CAEBR|nr:Protein CBG15828 [Caenorhabditis briggsae]CAP34004.2 Protein CBG15828 [Caenorhabditis briggsae]